MANNTTTHTPRSIYVACLASYNNGCLHGQWFDLTDYSDVKELQDAIERDVLLTSPYPNVTVSHPDTGEDVPSAEEYAVHDYDGIPSSFGEYPDLEAVLSYALAVEEHGEAWEAYVEHLGDYATAEGFEDAYMGCYDSPEDWAWDFVESCGVLDSVPENLRCYFDFEKYAREAELGGDISFVRMDGDTYVFSNH